MTSLDAKRAGRALYQATSSNGAARTTLDSLEQFATLIGEHADLREALMSPFVPADRKVAIITQITDLLGTAPAARHTLEVAPITPGGTPQYPLPGRGRPSLEGNVIHVDDRCSS